MAHGRMFPEPRFGRHAPYAQFTDYAMLCLPCYHEIRRAASLKIPQSQYPRQNLTDFQRQLIPTSDQVYNQG